MFRPLTRHIPPPPGAGLTKLADPRRVLSGWLAAIVLLSIALALSWPFGIGAMFGRLQRQFVASGYLRSAQVQARAVPARREQALAALNRAVKLAPDAPFITDPAAQLYVELRAYAEAAQWLGTQPGMAARPSEDLAGAPQELLTRISLAQSYLMTERPAEGERMLDEAQRAAYAARQKGLMPDPLFALILNNIAYVNTLAKRSLPDALQMLLVAVQLQPTEPAFVDSLGWVEYQLDRPAEAAFHLEQAVRLHLPKESAEIYYHLGAAYSRLGKKSDARWALRRALELDPSYLQAADELKTLSQDLPIPSVI